VAIVSTLLKEGAKEAGLFGLEQLTGPLVRIGVKVAMRVGKIDDDAGAEMVEGMRAAVPYDAGRLFNGIETWREGDSRVVQASTVRTSSTGKEGMDYAFLVEHGTAAGQRGGRRAYVAQAGYFDADEFGNGARRATPTPRARRVNRGHPGTPAQPFFYPVANEVLERRGSLLDSVLEEVASADNWEFA
jgi:hypothetical protein